MDQMSKKKKSIVEEVFSIGLSMQPSGASNDDINIDAVRFLLDEHFFQIFFLQLL